MPGKIFLDTSFIVALINDRDEHHEEAQALSWFFDTADLALTEAVILEIGNGLANGFRKEAVEVIRILRTSDKTSILKVDGELLEQAISLYAQHADKKWGLVDCLSFIVMRENGVTEALSFDHDFEQAGFTLLKV